MASDAATSRYPYPPEQPDDLRSLKKTAHNLGQLLLDTHAEVNDDSLALAESWQSATATTAVSDVQELSRLMKADSGLLGDAASALSTYVGAVETARGDIDDIRRRYDDARGDRDAANADMPDAVDTRWEREEQRQINQDDLEDAASGLDTEYDGVLTDLETAGRPVLEELGNVLDALAPPHLRQLGHLGAVAYEAASTGLSLTGNGYEHLLRQEGLLTGPTDEDSFYNQWLENAARQGVDPATILEIAREHDITPDSFDVLEGMDEITDPDGKSYFLIPEDTGGDGAREAVLMTYILNAGTDYDDAGQVSGVTNDFAETPYSATEVQRIIDRQEANSWSYDQDVGFVDMNGGRLVTTPNGMMMGLGGNLIQDLYSQKGGTAWGDIFMINIDDPDDAADQLRDIVESGHGWYDGDNGPYEGSLDLDRLLHHEERHSQQWADKGYWTMIKDAIFNSDEIEDDAGLSDGGY